MLSVVIITKNEEKNIKECLESVKDIANEIIIIDSYSNDNTVNIASKYTQKIFFKKFNNDFAEQRNHALNKCKSSWVLSIDGDEILSQPLKKIIPKLINNSKFKGYLIPRRNYINKNKWLKYGLFYPDYQLRLFNKKNVIYVNRLHEFPNIESKYLEKIKPYLIHNFSRTKYNSFLSIKKLFSKDHNHILIQAEDLLKQDKSSIFYIFKGLQLSIIYFINSFVLGKGFLDGFNGFRAAIIFSLFPVIYSIYAVLIRYKIVKYKK